VNAPLVEIRKFGVGLLTAGALALLSACTIPLNTANIAPDPADENPGMPRGCWAVQGGYQCPDGTLWTGSYTASGYLTGGGSYIGGTSYIKGGGYMIGARPVGEPSYVQGASYAGTTGYVRSSGYLTGSGTAAGGSVVGGSTTPINTAPVYSTQTFYSSGTYGPPPSYQTKISYSSGTYPNSPAIGTNTSNSFSAQAQRPVVSQENAASAVTLSVPPKANESAAFPPAGSSGIANSTPAVTTANLKAVGQPLNILSGAEKLYESPPVQAAKVVSSGSECAATLAGEPEDTFLPAYYCMQTGIAADRLLTGLH